MRMRDHAGPPLLLATLCGLIGSGCGAPTIPDGVFACTADMECPSGFSCVALRCHRMGDTGALDAGTLDAEADASHDAATPDGAPDAFTARDTGLDAPSDAPVLDTGIDASDAAVASDSSVDLDVGPDAGDAPLVCGANMHACGTSCFADDDPTHCGSLCVACAAGTGGTASCTSGSCGRTCNPTFYDDGTTCRPFDAPRLLSPMADQVASHRPTFRFAPFAGIAETDQTGEVEVCREPTCLTAEATYAGTSTSVTVTTALTTTYHGMRYWRARTHATGGRVSAWSPTHAFVTLGDAPGTLGVSYLNIAGGYHDVAVADPAVGLVELFVADSSNDLLGPLAHTTFSPPPLSSLDAFGSAVAPAGDVNGDGAGDLLIGSCRPEPGSAPTSCDSRAFLYLSRPDGTLDPRAPIVLLAPTGFESGFGASVAGLGDFDGDGYGDIAIGAYWSNAVFLYFGNPTGVDASPTRLARVPGSSPPPGDSFGLFGWAVGAAGDTDGDGRSDLVVGSPSLGEIRIFFATGSDGRGTPDGITFRRGPSTSSRYGFSVAGLNDVDGDGRSDVIGGAPGAQEAIVVGLSMRASGVADPTAPEYARILLGGPVGFGTSVASAGDLGRDGFADYVVADGSTVAVFAGGGTLSSTPTASIALLGRQLARIGLTVRPSNLAVEWGWLVSECSIDPTAACMPVVHVLEAPGGSTGVEIQTWMHGGSPTRFGGAVPL